MEAEASSTARTKINLKWIIVFCLLQPSKMLKEGEGEEGGSGPCRCEGAGGQEGGPSPA